MLRSLTSIPICTHRQCSDPRRRARAADWMTTLTLDRSSVASIISNNFVSAYRTLWREVRRRPWLSRLASDGSVDLFTVPPHGQRLRPARGIARELVSRLEREAMGAVRARNRIYLLLSGDLDSRVVAGVLKRLEIDGLLPWLPICLTWGLPDSRDVHYTCRIAEILGWQWTYAPL